MAGAAVISAIQNAVGRHAAVRVRRRRRARRVAPVDEEAAAPRSPPCRPGCATSSTSAARGARAGRRHPRRRPRRHRRRYRVGEVAYAMFAGGGAAWADREMKAGRFLVPGAPAGARPDLAGLSCRWNPIRARNGAIVSIIAVPGEPPRPRGVRRARDRGPRRARAARSATGTPCPTRGAGVPLAARRARRPRRARARPPAARGRARRQILFEAAVGKLNDLTGAQARRLRRAPASRRRRPQLRLPQVRRRAEAHRRHLGRGLRARSRRCSSSGAVEGVCRFGDAPAGRRR